MDYITKSTSRATLRRFSKIIRVIFGCESDDEPFPVLQALEKLPDIVECTNYEVVKDNDLPANVFAQCYPKPEGGFVIQIKETVYNGACYDENYVFLCFICHEICHVLLFWIGFTPVSTCAFGDDEIEPYRSVEWQAKALTGEVMIPYGASKGMTSKEIVKKYHVTKQSADYRVKQDKKKN
jgi:hypothetical protein